MASLTAPAVAQEAQTLPKSFSLPLTGNEIISVGVPGPACSAASQLTGSCGYSFQAITLRQLAALLGSSFATAVGTLDFSDANQSAFIL